MFAINVSERHDHANLGEEAKAESGAQRRQKAQVRARDRL